MNRTPAILAVVTAAAVVNCSGWDGHSLEDEGQLCFGDDQPYWSGDGQTVDLRADESIVLTYVAVECLSGSCSQNGSASCEVTESAGGLTVTSQAYWETERSGLDTGFAISCTLDCQVLSATCETPPLTAGTHVLTHGDAELALEVPSTVPVCPSELE